MPIQPSVQQLQSDTQAAAASTEALAASFDASPTVDRRLNNVSPEGLRLFSVIAQAVAVFVTGLMARELAGLYARTLESLAQRIQGAAASGAAAQSAAISGAAASPTICPQIAPRHRSKKSVGFM